MIMIVLDFMMEANHEVYLSILLSTQLGKPVSEVLRLWHLRPDHVHEGLAYPAPAPPDHLWVRDDLRVWLDWSSVSKCKKLLSEIKYCL